MNNEIKQSIENESSQSRQYILSLTKSHKMNEFTSERIVEKLTQKDLIKLRKIMKKQTSLTITTFLRIFRAILSPTLEDDFYLTYGLFRLFHQACLQFRKNELTFSDFSAILTQKMPSSNQQIRLAQKLYPLDLQIPENIKKQIFAPQIIGKVLEQRQRLEQRPYISDKFLHLNRRVAQTIYSKINDEFLTIDYPSTEIKILNPKFEHIKSLSTQLQISKRDAIVTWIAWSQHQQRLAAILGNYSISLWAKQDDFRYEVNVPLSLNKLGHPYLMLGYMQSSKIWWALDDRPTVYILSPYNFEPEYQFTHFKMIKQKPTEKIYTVQIKYRKLLCLAFERSVFVLSLNKRELITQLTNFKTNITSIAFSQTYQALFVSNFNTSFSSYQLSEHQDLTQIGAFQGHKGLVTLLGVLQGRPVVFSIDQRSIIKLWDMRDFSCYQTFQILRNVDFHQVILLAEAVCFVGSKHFCYRWQYFSQFKQKQKVILINELHKNVVIVTSKQVRLYNHSNGVLIKVIKGVFGNIYIVKAFLIQIRKILLLANEEGQIKIYSTKDFSFVISLILPPKPHSFNFEKQTQLLTIVSMGEIRINTFKEVNDFTMKRRIYNNKQLVRICKISTSHDLIAVQYDSSHLFFYSYERAKGMGFLILQDLVKVQFLPGKNVTILLCKNKLMIFSFKKSISSVSFFLKKKVDLWQSSDVIIQQMKHLGPISSTDLVIFSSQIIISSNFDVLQCKLKVNLKLIKQQISQIHRQNYNPYRVANENHLESFELNKPSLIIDQTNNLIVQQKIYIRQSSKIQKCQLLSKVDHFYCITNQQQINFLDLQGEIKGKITCKDTLPILWNLHNYTQQQFTEFQFVLDFINQQKPIQQESQIIANAQQAQNSEQIITINMLSSSKQKNTIRSNSLRQKKMILEKQRDEKQKYENFLEIRQGEELIKLKQINRSTNQKYVSQSLAFFNINRNKLLLSKGLPQNELPQVRTLQAKLNAVINRDQKKSMVSKYSHPFQFASPVKKQTIIQQTTPKIKERKLMQDVAERQSIKDHLRKLDLTLRQSKFQHKLRSNSLPLLKAVNKFNRDI